MEPIGVQIQSLRKQQQVTQKDLAQAVGVSTQAVSKWESGGVPDATLLPAIADFFHVSIDTLYARTHEKQQPISNYVYKQLQNYESEERNQECLKIFCALFNACSDFKDIATIMDSDALTLYDANTIQTFGYCMATDQSIALMSLMSNSPYAMFLPEPKQGYEDALLSKEEFVDFFTLLSEPLCIDVIFLILHRNNGFTKSSLALQLETKEENLTPILEKMKTFGWLSELRVDLDDSCVVVYNFEQRVTMLPLLVLVSDLYHLAMAGYFLVTREKPLLYHNEEKK